MKIRIERTYLPTATNGELYINGLFFCYTIELRWLQNKFRVSCIPAGTYELVPFDSPKLGAVINIKNVPNRDGVHIHKANNANTQLWGCIAPVTTLTGAGTGTGSTAPTEQLRQKVVAAHQRGERVTLTIVKKKVRKKARAVKATSPILRQPQSLEA